MTGQDLRTTALHSVHERLGASFTDFAGWSMPVRYSSDLAEHKAVRASAGIFDLSHMGEIFVTGEQCGEYLDYAFAGKLSGIGVGRAKYTLLLQEDGGVIDDLIVNRLDEKRYMVVANASNAEVDAEEMRKRAEDFDVTVTDSSLDYSLIAVQGPESADIVTRGLTSGAEGITAEDIADLKYYRVLQGTYQGDEILVARTGYTGEDGFELYVPNAHAESLWDLMVSTGGDSLVPCGLAARDSLRLEAGMPLYGNELGRDKLPAQSGLEKVVALSSKGDFVGRSGIENTDVSDRPVLVGLTAEGRRAARAGSAVKDSEGTEVGVVTSGALSPTLGHPIAMAFVRPDLNAEGTELVIDVRGKDLPATVTALPFYTRS
ncbi:glycine cleavage system aminomethyltransferase GcvT [Brachybacterium sp. EF45031]|uniref:glycine cleavage system aminomethyltransferase GcvT n=1 Tax=Brachybacterium sillae TaxID=2810536 RepID=UPI00217E3B43|nr:glycine cleavage system aminomethyltransferase GcvT [Brachybacterium sillae]MCS6712556.1 glycine cleavage system aminomethyltransferase GcvT [Brachybacterium sillae]